MHKDISSKVLTLSTEFIPPKGGIAQVINAYSEFYPVFNHIKTTVCSSKLDNLLIFIIAIFKLLYFCIFKKIKIVHIHGASYNSFWRKYIFIHLSKFLRKKVIYHIHGAEFKNFFETHPISVNHVFKKVDTVIALSSSWKSFFKYRIKHPDVKIVENVVVLPTVKKITSDNFVHFLFLGELGHRKGIYDIIDAIYNIRESLNCCAKFHIGGNGEIDKVKRRISELGLDDIIIFEGWVSGEKKINLLNLADVYILPSYNEGLPISILEAMSYRLPIISTPVGGIPEILIQNDNGILIEPGDKRAIGEAILRMIDDMVFRHKAGESSYIKVRPYFPDNVAKKLETIYIELLE